MNGVSDANTVEEGCTRTDQPEYPAHGQARERRKIPRLVKLGNDRNCRAGYIEAEILDWLLERVRLRDEAPLISEADKTTRSLTPTSSISKSTADPVLRERSRQPQLIPGLFPLRSLDKSQHTVAYTLAYTLWV